MKRPTLLTVTGALCLAIGTIAMAGAPDNSPRPETRPATDAVAMTSVAMASPAPDVQAPTVQSAKLTTESEESPVINPWGAKRYEKVWRSGDKIGSYNFHLLAAWRRYKLPQLPQGQVYVALGRQVLTVNSHDWVVVATVGDVSKIIG